MKIGDKVSVKGTGVLGPVVRVNATEALVRTTDDRGYTETGAYIGAVTRNGGTPSDSAPR